MKRALKVKGYRRIAAAALLAIALLAVGVAATLLWSGKVGEMTMVVQAPAVTVKEVTIDLGNLSSYTTYELAGYDETGWIDIEHLGSAKIVITVLNGTGIDYFEVWLEVSNQTNRPATFLNTTGWQLEYVVSTANGTYTWWWIPLNSTHNTAVIEVTGGNITINIDPYLVSTGIVPQNTTTSLVVQVEVLPGTKKPTVLLVKT